MPKIRITEKDLTGVQASSTTDTVYIPGETDEFKSTNISSKIQLCTDSKTLANIANISNISCSYKMAKYCLDTLGLNVLYQTIPGNWSEASESSESSILIGPNYSVIDWDKLADKGAYDITYLTLGGLSLNYGLNNSSEIVKDSNASNYSTIVNNTTECKMIYAAAKRGDAIALIDLNQNCSEVSDVRNVAESLSNVCDYYYQNFQNVNNSSTYAACFVPAFDVKTNTSALADLGYAEDVRNSSSNTSTKSTYPASFGYLSAYSNMLNSNPEYYAVAGYPNGVINELASVKKDYDNAECEILQARGKSAEVELGNDADNVGVAINPIADIRPNGYQIWGNRTLTNNSGTLKALSFLNIRRLVTTIKKLLWNTCRRYTFAQNTDLLWLNFSSQITPVLEKMKLNNGILGYKFTQVDTTKKARLCANLKIIPIEPVEDFDIEIELTDTLSIE